MTSLKPEASRAKCDCPAGLYKGHCATMLFAPGTLNGAVVLRCVPRQAHQEFTTP